MLMKEILGANILLNFGVVNHFGAMSLNAMKC